MRRSLLPALALLLVATSCGGGGERVAMSPAAEAVQGLCEAEDQVGRGRIDEARRAFQDRSHAYLHELAAELQDTQRELAAQLLEAKEQVESMLQSNGDPEVLAGRLGALRTVLEASLAARGRPVPGCPS